MKKFLLSTFYSLLFTVLIGCATAPEVITDSYLKPEIDFSKYERIAVMGFTDAPNAAGSGKEIADIAGLEMLKKGYNILERNQVEFLLQEQKLGLSGVLDPQTATQVGNILGVKAIVTGTVGTYHREKVYQGGAEINLPWPMGPMKELTRIFIPGGETLKYEVSLTIKMVDVETGIVVWIASGSLSGSETSANLAKKIIIQCLKTIPLQKSKKKRG
jgi:curli biogenesis system outer membrane secretion channel CsgG